jgi:hypothetical protein
VDCFHHFHEFIFAELAIFVLIEFCEHLLRIWPMSTASACRATFARLTASASAAHLSHFFARFGTFFII